MYAHVCTGTHVWGMCACLVKYVWKPEIIIRYHYLSIIHFNYLFGWLVVVFPLSFVLYNRA